jgi:hypothetical protein
MPGTDTIQPLSEANEALLPPLYARWVTGLLKDRIPNESLATCHDCAMCSVNQTAQRTEIRYFNPSVKCCTYTPSLPNFLVGAILLDPNTDPTGRQSVIQRLVSRVGVSPLAMAVPPEYGFRYGVMAPEAFGRVPTMRCPHYLDRDGGLCGIWRHRNSVCSTWFCKLVRGRVGQAFWESLRNMLCEVEEAVSLWAIDQVGVGVETLRSAVGGPDEEEPRLSQYDLSGTVDHEDYARVWGDWSGRESEFFQACAQRVKPLTWSEVVSIGGATLQAHSRVVLEDFAKLKQTNVPPALELGQFEILSATSNTFHVCAYSAGDPLEISPALMKVLPYFDGRRTEEILASIARKERIEIDHDLLIRLLDCGLLKESNKD